MAASAAPPLRRDSLRRACLAEARASACTRLSEGWSFLRGLLPGARLQVRVIVEKEDRVPDLFLLQELLPNRHGRVPGAAFLRKPGASLGNPPEEKRLAKLRDRVVEVGRERVQTVHEHAVGGHGIAVAEDAVPIVDLAPV